MRATLSVALAAVAAAAADPGWELRVTNAETVSRTCFEAPGLPSSVRGSYFLAGPGKFDGLPEATWKYEGIFDGLGVVNKFELHPADQPGKVCYTSTLMNTGNYQEFAKDHKEAPRGVIFEDTNPPRSKCLLSMCDYEAPNDNNWVNMIPVGGEALWLSDTNTMVRMDPATLNMTGKKVWADDKKSITGMSEPSWTKELYMAMGGSAHPLPVPGSPGTYAAILTESPLNPLSKQFFTDVYTFQAGVNGLQSRKKVASVPADAGYYMHSFGLTQNHVVLPYNMVLSGIGPGHKALMLGKFQEKWAGLHVANIESGEVQVYDDVVPFDHVHIANTFENASGIVMDIGSYDQSPFQKTAAMDMALVLNKTARDDKSNVGELRRVHLNNLTKKTSVEKLVNTGRTYDFFKINPALNGIPYCIYYCVEWFHDDAAYASMAIMKHNICKGEISYWAAPDTYVNEPFFIAAGGAEDDGTVIFTAIDGQKRKAIFVALDAKSFKQVELIELPTHIPFTAHGSFIPATSVETIAEVLV